MTSNPHKSIDSDPLNRNLFAWESGDYFKIRDSLDGGIFISGQSGSGKTSSSGSLLAGHFLRNGYCGLILSAKSEVERWTKLCRAYGREDDLIIFGPDYSQCLNFFDYEVNRNDKGKGIAHNIADVILTVIQSGSEDKSGSDKAFWQNSLRELIVNTLEVCRLTQNTNLKHLFDIIQSAPLNASQILNKDWQSRSKCFQALHHIGTFLKKRLEEDPSDNDIKAKAHILDLAETYFYQTFPNLSEKTRSVILQYFTGFADRFMREPLYSLFQGKTTITPENILENGKIVVLDLPYVNFEKTGKDSQVLWKHLLQRSIQRRIVKKFTAPCMIFSDECQYFLTKHDPLFQSTSREYRACSIYITQNLPNMYLQLGGELGKTRFRALVGNLGTKIFHANSDPETNQYCSELMGKEWVYSNSHSESYGESLSFNQGQSQTMQYIVSPSEFSKLKTGGPDNNFVAEAYVHRQGKIFQSTGSNYKKVTLNQILL